MTEFLQFLLVGLGPGGAYALLGLGVVIVYRGSGVLNFAHGAFALVGAAFYYEVSQHHPVPVAIAVGILASAMCGALTQVFVMQPLRRTTPLTRAIATLALLAGIQVLAEKRYKHPVFVEAFLPHGQLEIGGISIGEDRVAVVLVTVALTGLLWAFYHYSRFGVATTGVAENELATAALGWSPPTVALWNWIGGGALAGLAGILLVPITGVSPTALTLSIVPALAAGVVGGFASFPLTLLGGILVGVLESESTHYIKAPGWPAAVPFLLIVALLIVRGRSLPLRSHLQERLPQLGTGRPHVVGLVIGLALLTLSTVVFTASWSAALITTAVYGLICLSLVVVTGYGGQLSLAQFSLAGIGALTASRLSDVFGIPFVLAFFIGIVVTIVAGIVVALPAIRVRGVNLAVVTMGLAVVITAVVLGNPDFTGGPFEGTVVETPRIFGIDFDSARYPERYALLCIGLFVIAGLMVANLRRGRTGRRLIAIRDNERGAASLGVSGVTLKLYAFGVAAGLAAAGGVLLAFQQPHVVFDQYNVFTSINAVLLAVIGGIGSIVGAWLGATAAVGAVTQQIIAHWFDVSGWFALVSAVLLLIVVFVNPDGMAIAQAEHLRNLMARLRARRRTRDEAQPEEPAQPTRLEVEPVPPKALEVRDVSVRFGGVRALTHVTLDVRPGEIVGLIGPNGAGKTTLIDAVTGFVKVQEGTVTLDGAPLDALSVPKRARRGVTRSFQSLELFDDLTVGDNLRVASEQTAWYTGVVDLLRPGRRPFSPVALATIAEFRLDRVLDRRPSTLPYAQRRMAAIARSVAAAPSILLLDEPAAGLDDVATGELSSLIKTLASSWGMGILLIEHDVSMVLDTCDRVVALDFGEVLAEGTPDEIRHDPGVVAAYIGAPVAADVEPADVPSRILSV